MGRDRDLVLAPGEFAYVLDTTKGQINVNVGPYKTSMAGTDQPVVFDKQKLRFERCEMERAIQRDLVAPEGFYLVLFNPAKSNAHPDNGKSSIAQDLTVGHRINIPGPAHFALWPGQMADVVRGHHLRSNQYLVAQVYNDAEATTNWQQAIVKPQGGGEASTAELKPKTFSPGQMIVIKGTDVAFFIPPTGIKVVATEDDKFVREAVTLERLEYSILLDEAGNKRFVQGPAVVFPEPTEKFVKGKDGERKFLAIELNETTGIYVKVIADYEEEVGGLIETDHVDKPAGSLARRKIHHKAGDELFITGKEQALYFQREEHSVIRYGDQTKHYAVAIPAGEGRYVLNRLSGAISLVKGPRMLLCDPRTEVIVRRALSPKAVTLMYPGNTQAAQINQQIAAAARPDDSTQYDAARVHRAATATLASTGVGAAYMAMNVADDAAKASRQLAGDTFARGTSFTPPRTLTLDTKYEGAVAVDVWPGYAVNVVNKVGGRKVVEGPTTVLLEYDESLAPIGLSTGTPKTADTLLETVYLRVSNNPITDVVAAETSDFVPVQIKVSYRVEFGTPHKDRWFAVENYVGLLTDNARSMIRNAVKRTGVEVFYATAIDVVRDTILGPVTEGKRHGRTFSENGMRIYDVEVLEVKIGNADVRSSILSCRSACAISTADAIDWTDAAKAIAESTNGELGAQLSTALIRVQNELAVETERLNKQREQQEAIDELDEAALDRRRAAEDFAFSVRERAVKLEMEALLKQTEEIVKRTNAVTPTLATAMTTFSDQALVKEIATALAPMAAMNGVSAADVLAKLLDGTPWAGVMKALGERTRVPLATSDTK